MKIPAEKSVFNKLVMGLMLAFFGSIAIMSTIDIISGYGSGLSDTGILVLAFLLCLSALALIFRIRGARAFMLALAVLAFSLRVAWIVLVKTQPDSDYYVMYAAARKAAKGDFSFNTDPYFAAWAYQMGFTLYQSLIIRLFGEGILSLKLINCIISTGTVILVYKTGETVFNERAGRLAGLLYCVYPPVIIADSVLTNQIMASFLFSLAGYLLVADREEKRSTYVLVGMLFALADIVRPLAPVMLAVFILYRLIRFISAKDRKLLLNTGIALLTFFVIFEGTGRLLTAAKISPNGLDDRDPLWKFVIGLNYATSGQYSDEDALYVSGYALGEERNGKELELIRERTASPARLGKLMLEKYAIMWGTEDSMVYWSADVGQPKLMEEVGESEQIMYLAAALAALIAAAALFRSKNEKAYLFALLLLIYMGAHLLIEIQTRYRDFILPAMFILAGFGLSVCRDALRKRAEPGR